MSDRFDLNHLIRDVLARGEAGADPATIAKSVMREISPRCYGEALAQAMPWLVRVAMSRARMDTTVVLDSDSREDVGDRADNVLDVSPKQTANRRPGRAHNRDAIREHWRKSMLDRECVNGDWKRYGLLTVDDLHWLRDDRHKTASQYAAKAEWYGHVADLLQSHGVGTVEELPEAVLAATFQPRRRSEGDAA